MVRNIPLQFEDFSRKLNFDHVTSSSRYSQSNGFAERTVQTVKKILKKVRNSSTSPLLPVLEHRTNPSLDTGCIPTQVLMSRKFRSVVPCLPIQLVPETEICRAARLYYGKPGRGP